ncbi:Ig-like domain-containing protein [Candidatus Altiarchaeota archaeon]
MMALRDKGYFFTVAIIILVIPLVLLLGFRYDQQQFTVEDTAGKIRCDELQYFVEDVKRDLDRAMSVFGRRATIYAVDYVVTNNQPLEDYVFQNCTSFVYNGNGSTAAIAELILCATIDGNNVSGMINHTLPIWIEKMETQGVDMNFRSNISLNNITLVPYDAFNFAVIINNSVGVEDESGLCFYEGTSVVTTSFTSILGLEDPLYPLYTNGLITKPISNCSEFVEFNGIVGCNPDHGDGLTGGEALLYSSQLGSQNALESYCQNNDRETLMGKVLVADQSYAGNCSQTIQDCLLANSTKSFAGVVDYEDSPNLIQGLCNATTPWINATGDLGAGGGDPSCGTNTSLSVEEDSCLYLYNQDDDHLMFLGINPREVNTSCYRLSNVSNYGVYCPEQYGNGPSYFDRLDGNLNLSQKYVNLSLKYFNTTDIGLESMVNPYDLLIRGLTVNTSATWTDYLYWQGVSACEIFGVCKGVYTYAFRYDCPHAEQDNLTSSCFATYNQPPISEITDPASGSEYDTCPHNLMIKGNATDSDGNVTLVEVSWDGGLNWTIANGTTLWNISWDPGVDGVYMIQSRAIDNNGTVETPSSGISVTLDGCGGCPLSWTDIYNIDFDTDYVNPQVARDNGPDDESDNKFIPSGDVGDNITLWSYVKEYQDGQNPETDWQTTWLNLDFKNDVENCFREVSFDWRAMNDFISLEPSVCGDWEVRVILKHNGTDTTYVVVGDPGSPDCVNESDPIEPANFGIWEGSVPEPDTIQEIKFEVWSEASTQDPPDAEGYSNTTFYIDLLEASP